MAHAKLASVGTVSPRENGYDPDSKGVSHMDQDGIQPPKLVLAIYRKYKLQLSRWRSYRNLFWWLGFMALYLAVLISQRNAQQAYQVYNTVSNMVLPADTSMQGTAAVYAWLQTLLQTVWVDPVCGDGVCEAPFEFASYGRFGCKADCGLLSKVQNLSAIQIDLYYDFSHPAGSLPASTLMQQASWNLCPVQTAFSSACYYDSDQPFAQVTGEQHVVITDAPDGNWDLVIKRDIFDKVQGAVRSTPKVQTAGFYTKVFVAATAASSEQAFELNLLQTAINISTSRLLDWTWTYWGSQDLINVSRDAFDLVQLRNATCVCSNGTWALNNTVGYTNDAIYLANNCSGVVLSDRAWPGAAYNTSAGAYTVITPPADPAGLCSELVANLTELIANMTSAVQVALVDNRLGNQRDTGKFAVRIAISNGLQTYLSANAPELVDPVFNTPTGLDALNDPEDSTLALLIALYVDGPVYYNNPAPAYLNLTRNTVYNPSVTFATLATMAQARVVELAGEQAATASINVPGPLGTFTVGAITGYYAAAGANSTVVPDAASPALAPLNVTYNLSAWQGNTTAYMECSLPTRGPTYVGTCIEQTVNCVSTTNDTVPYNCTIVASGASVPGNLSSISYRSDCELPCDRQMDCNAICECYGTCNATQICSCAVCESLNAIASQDAEYEAIAAVASGNRALVLADVSVSAALTTGRRRSLLDAASDQQAVLSAVASVNVQLDDLRSQQTSITTSMGSLTTQMTAANQLAAQRAADTTVQDLITAGRTDIQTGQAAVMAQLNTLIGQQQAALNAVNLAVTSLAAIQTLQTAQTNALTSLEGAVQNQLSALKVAAQQNVISLTQALALWKRARRDRELAVKAFKLANLPCQSTPSADNLFILNNGNTEVDNSARNRNVGLNNRVVGGLLLHQWRTRPANCSASRYSGIDNGCVGALDTSPYGVDPNFNAGTTMYNADLMDPDNLIVQQYYNCSQLSVATYNLTDALNRTINLPPFCAELYNSMNLPHAFYFFSLGDLPDGFPIWLDINLDATGAQNYYNYINQGLFLDTNTQYLRAEMITYNADLRMFCAISVRFTFNKGGSIDATNRIYTIQLELYETSQDAVRFAAEIILTVLILTLFGLQLFGMVMAQMNHRSFLRYFKSGWNWLDFISNGLMAACMAIWWIFAKQRATDFKMNLTYKVYGSLTPTADYLQLNDAGSEMREAWKAFDDMSNLVSLLNWYYALTGINILLMIARTLWRVDFQPRLGIITRSLAKAAPDLIHFVLVLGTVFVSFSMMAYLIFGNAVQKFSTMTIALNTCFEMMLGNIDVNTDLRLLDGLQGTAGVIFFWAYMITCFLVLLNFLLAIIVDAFSEVKDDYNHETTGVHTDLLTLARAKWRGALGWIRKRYVSDKRLDTLLRRWAGLTPDGRYDEMEEEELRRQRKAMKRITVMHQEYDEPALRTVFSACSDEQHTDPKAQQQEGQASVLSPDEEMAQAAKLVMDRLGTKPKKHKRHGGRYARRQGKHEDEEDKAERLEGEREELAAALERLAETQRGLSEAQRTLMTGQKSLAEQQAALMSAVVQQQQQHQQGQLQPGGQQHQPRPQPLPQQQQRQSLPGLQLQPPGGQQGSPQQQRPPMSQLQPPAGQQGSPQQQRQSMPGLQQLQPGGQQGSPQQQRQSMPGLQPAGQQGSPLMQRPAMAQQQLSGQQGSPQQQRPPMPQQQPGAQQGSPLQQRPPMTQQQPGGQQPQYASPQQRTPAPPPQPGSPPPPGQQQ